MDYVSANYPSAASAILWASDFFQEQPYQLAIHAALVRPIPRSAGRR